MVWQFSMEFNWLVGVIRSSKARETGDLTDVVALGDGDGSGTFGFGVGEVDGVGAATLMTLPWSQISFFPFLIHVYFFPK